MCSAMITWYDAGLSEASEKSVHMDLVCDEWFGAEHSDSVCTTIRYVFSPLFILSSVTSVSMDIVCKCKDTKLKHLNSEDVPLVEFMHLAFTRMPGETYRRRFRSLLLYLCYVFRALNNSLVC